MKKHPDTQTTKSIISALVGFPVDENKNQKSKVSNHLTEREIKEIEEKKSFFDQIEEKSIFSHTTNCKKLMKTVGVGKENYRN